MLLIVALIATIRFYTPKLDDSWQTPWNFRDWHFGRYETRMPFKFSPVISFVRSEQTMILVTSGFHFGPLHVFSVRSEMEPQPLGTNEVKVGMVLLDPATQREIWRVLAVERKHEFDDDTDRDGVLVRSTVNGGEGWLPREKIGKVLVGR